MCSGSRHCATRRDDLGSIPGRVLGNYKVTYSFCPHSVLLVYTQPVTNEYEGDFLWCNVRPARGADTSAFLVVPSFKMGLEYDSSLLVTGVLHILHLFHPKL